MRFRVDKPATVGMTIRRGGRTYLATSASVQHGTHAYGWWAPRARGSYAVTLDATDLAGNYARSTATLNLGR